MRALTACILVLFLSVTVARADGLTDDGLSGPGFDLAWPQGWRLKDKTAPFTLLGPSGESLLVSAMAPRGETAEKVGASKKMEDFWRERIKAVLSHATTGDGVTVLQPVTESQSNGLPFFAARSQHREAGAFRSGYGLIGRHGYVIIVIAQGPIETQVGTETAAEGVLKGIKWAQPSKQ